MNKLMKLISVAALALLFSVLARPAIAQGSPTSYLVVANSNRLSNNLMNRIEAAGGVVTNTLPEIGVAVVESSAAGFDATLYAIPGVLGVAENALYQFTTPGEYDLSVEFANPPASGDDDPLFDLQWGHTAIDAATAWNAGLRGAGARVAVLDGGFDLDHPDLAPNINMALSRNFVAGETLQYELPDPFSHGSHTAGTVAAADNGIGTIGVAPEAELVLVKVLGDSGTGSFEDVWAGIIYAADVDADIINMSLGATFEWVVGKGTNENAALIVANARAVRYAYQAGTTVITSAGNEGINFDLPEYSQWIKLPADAPHAISISAVGPLGWGVDPSTDLDTQAFYTNLGQSAVSFSAPGGTVDFDLLASGDVCTVAGITRPCYVFDFVFSTGNGTWYWSIGTSMAAPHAAGVAALIVGANGGDMHPAQVEAALAQYADDLGKPGNDDLHGAGRVSAGNLVD